MTRRCTLLRFVPVERVALLTVVAARMRASAEPSATEVYENAIKMAAAEVLANPTEVPVEDTVMPLTLSTMLAFRDLDWPRVEVGVIAMERALARFARIGSAKKSSLEQSKLSELALHISYQARTLAFERKAFVIWEPRIAAAIDSAARYTDPQRVFLQGAKFHLGEVHHREKRPEAAIGGERMQGRLTESGRY